MQWDRHQSGTGQLKEAEEPGVAREFSIPGECFCLLAQAFVFVANCRDIFSRPLPAVPFWFSPICGRRYLRVSRYTVQLKMLVGKMSLCLTMSF